MDVVVADELCLRGRYVSNTAHLVGLAECDPLELAWAAGFFDGEGCTYFSVSQAGFADIALVVPQQDGQRVCLERFARAVGGIGAFIPRHKREGYWHWRARSWRNTQTVLSLLWPYLSEPKRAQARACFAAYQAHVDQHPGAGRRCRQHGTVCAHGHQSGMYVYTERSGRVRTRCIECRRLSDRKRREDKKM